MTSAFALALVLLHGPGGGIIHINPEAVTSLRAAPPDETDKHFTDEARCMINLSDGKFVSVIETCEAVRSLIKEAKP